MIHISVIIAVTSPITDNGDSCLSRAYTDAIIRAGGIPIIIPPIKKVDAAHITELADGVLFTGGGDIIPRFYGVEDYDSALLYDPRPMRDEYELELARICFERDIPTLGICRGVQVMNVALGGTLHFHIDGHAKTHRCADPHHGVSVAPNSNLSHLVGGELYTNTAHHQAIDAVGDGLCAVAYADDGITEAVEAPSRRFFIGVQWHPERERSYASDVIFAAFIAACM